MDVTSMPPSLHTSVVTPDSQAIVSASVFRYGFKLAMAFGPAVVEGIVGIVPSALYVNYSRHTER